LKAPVKPTDVPALDIEPAFVNVFNVVMSATTTRIALGEFVIGDPNKHSRYRHALVMPTGDAIALANLILSLAEGKEIGQAPSTSSFLQ